MPLDGNGKHNPPSPENPVRAGTLIKSEDFNSTIDDISDALSTAMYRDGQAVMSGDLSLGHNNLVQVKSLRNDGAMSIYTDDKLTITAKKDFQQDIGGNVIISTPKKVNISAGEGVVVNNNLQAKSLQLQDGVKVSRHTARGGISYAGQSVILNNTGLVDTGMLPFIPSPSEVLLRAKTGAALNAGDFVYMATNGDIMPISANNPQATIIGFVLEDYAKGVIAEVIFAGINNRITVIGNITDETRIAYTNPKVANQVLTNGGEGQAVGIILNATTIYFRGQMSENDLVLLKYISSRSNENDLILMRYL